MFLKIVKSLTLAGLATALAAAGIRIWQLGELISPTTGFYTRAHWTAPLLTGALLAALAAAVLLLIAGRKKTAPAAEALFTETSPVRLFLVSIAALLAAASCFANTSKLFSPAVTDKLPFACYAVAYLCAAVFFGLMFLYECRRCPRPRLAGLLAVAFCIIRLILVFIHFETILNTPLRVAELLSLIALMLFFYAQAKALAFSLPAGSYTAAAFAAAVLTPVTALPRLWLALQGSVDCRPLFAAQQPVFAFALDTVLALYAALSLWQAGSAARYRQTEAVPFPSAEEEPPTE
ncbi:MAG: hypothetical protein IKD06_04135 [Clostridia bacterium]|nr:hypothetical protein [Clostridia bacterium]